MSIETVMTQQKVVMVCEMTILGSQLSTARLQRSALQARERAAWHTWSQARHQLKYKLVPVSLRMRMLDAVILPTVMWGLETIVLTQADRRKLDGMQRAMIQRMQQVPQRPKYSQREMCRGRERLCSAALRTWARGEWGRLQRYRR